MKTSECRSCGATIIWVITQKNRKRMPVDAEAVSGGRWILEPGDTDPETPVAVYIGANDPYVGERYESHFSTCPNAAQHSKKGKSNASAG